MSQPPFGPSYGPPTGPPTGPPPPPRFQAVQGGHPSGPAFAPGYGQPPAPPKKSRTGLKVAAGLGAGALLLGGVGAAGIFAYSKVDGSGPQPEEALPADAIAFAKVDLDPSADQKLDAYRFLRKLPDADKQLGNPADDADLRKVVFDAIQKDGGLQGVSYDQDIEPWLGDRFGVAMLPGSDQGTPEGVVALAVTDVDKAKAGLSKATADGSGYCSVGEEYAICGTDQAVVDKAVSDAAGSSLADATEFTEDMDALGEDGIATAWVDGEAVGTLSGAPFGVDSSTSGATKQAGRTAMALRFDGPNLELVGTSTSPQGQLVSDDTVSVDTLPASTVAMFSMRGLGPNLTSQWGQLEQQLKQTVGDSQWQSGMDEVKSATGLSLPDDFSALLGDDTSFVLGGMGSDDTPKMGMVSNGDKGKADTLVSTLSSQGSTPVPLVTTDGQDGRYVLASEDAYAQELASGSGLADDETFRDAVPDAGDANAVLFVDVTEAVKAYGSDMDEETRRNLDSLGGVGMSVTNDGDRADFRLRVTTK